MEFNADDLLRANIRNLTPYSSARDEFKGKAELYLDANENSFGSPLQSAVNRYPDPLQIDLKEKIGKVKGLQIQNIFLGNGSDEPIDLLIRAFCEPGKDNILICPPTYGMYEVSAKINGVDIVKVPLLPDFQLDLEGISEAVTDNTKILFICSPNNPTGNSMEREDMEIILNNFPGIVVVDEAYINFSRQRSMIPELTEYPNLVVLQTFSKAWGMAGLRLGMAFASEAIIGILNRIKPPYNINTVTQELAVEALEKLDTVNAWIKETVAQRELLFKQLAGLEYVQKVFPSDANFLLVKVPDPLALYNYLADKGTVVRDRSKQMLCEGCLRITVGTPAQNEILMQQLKEYRP